MEQLSTRDLRSRLAYDARVCRRLSSPYLTLVGHTSYETLRAGIAATEAEGEAGRAEYYTARFQFDMLRNAYLKLSSATFAFNLLAGGNYPFSAPVVSVITHPFPWSPHVHSKSGSVCIGEAWEASQGQMLMAQLVIHLMRVFNCDEPDRGHSYVGWNPDAVEYWRETMKCQPVTPGLQYPALPLDLTHGPTSVPTFKPRAASTFIAAAPASTLRPMATPPLSSGGMFRAPPAIPVPSPTFRRGGSK